MSSFGYTRQQTVFNSSSANSSTFTSASFLVADAQQISVSYTTVAAAAQSLLVQGSNDDGLSAAAPALAFSTISSVAAQGIFTITPGARWIRFVRNAVDSTCSAVLNYRVY